MEATTNILKKILVEPEKCFVTGCKNTATHLVTPLFNAPSMKMCDKCKPDINNRPEALKNLPFTYKVESISTDKTKNPKSYK